jgi:hypothetical protein
MRRSRPAWAREEGGLLTASAPDIPDAPQRRITPIRRSSHGRCALIAQVNHRESNPFEDQFYAYATCGMPQIMRHGEMPVKIAQKT